MRSYLRTPIAGIATALSFAPALAAPVGTAFTYQGQLKLDGVPVTQTCDFAFRLFDAATTPPGDQVGPTLTFVSAGIDPSPIAVDKGLFEVALDFGTVVFRGEARWLQIDVCCSSPCAPSFISLSPRQELTAAPYALFALNGGSGGDGHSLDAADGVPVDAVFVDNDGRVGIGTTGPGAKLHIGGTPGVDGVMFPDGTLQKTAASGGAGGNTLDQAYDQGGAGAGRTITANAGAVNIAGAGGLTVLGRVGIGSAAPAGKLHVAGSSPFVGTGVVSSAGTMVNGSGTEFGVQLQEGDTLVVGAQRRYVVNVGSDILLATNTPFDPPLTNSVFSIQKPLTRITTLSGVTAMAVSAGGNVAIGTAVPSAKLTVAGAVESTAVGFKFPDASLQASAALGDGHSLDAADGNPADALFVDAAGHVGIGTVLPSAQLQLHKSSTSPADTVRLDALPDENPGIAFTVDNQAGARIRLNDSANDQLQFTIFDTLGGSPIDALSISTSGNVGIGESDPATLLSLNNGAGHAAGITQGQVAGASSMELTTSDSLGVQATRFLLRGNADDGDVEFYRGARGAEQQTMIIDGATGNVGIGTSSPLDPLEVHGDCTISDQLRADSVSVLPSSASVAVRGRVDRADGVGVLGETSFVTDGAIGVKGEGLGSSGVNYGVWGETNSADGYGGYFTESVAGIEEGIPLFAEGSGEMRFKPALRVNNTGSQGVAAYMTNDSSSATVHLYNNDSDVFGDAGPVLFLQNGGTGPPGTDGGDFIVAWNKVETDLQFRVTTTGEAQSDVGFTTPAADFAEMLPAGSDDVSPGDVLALDSHGLLVRSTKAFQRTVVGVYSTQPGFVGGKPLEGTIEGTIPLAVVGIVPVNVSGENGRIQPGDVLVASSSFGFAMRGGDDPPNGTVIGKALQSFSDERGVIRMLVLPQ